MEAKENKIPSRPVNPPNLCDDCGGYRVRHMQGVHECECLLPHGIAWKYLDNVHSQSPLKKYETEQRLALAEDIIAIVAQTKKYVASQPTTKQSKGQSAEEIVEKWADLLLSNSEGVAFEATKELLVKDIESYSTTNVPTESEDFKIIETDTELRIKHKDIEFESIISKVGVDSTRGKPTPTWKYIEYLRSRISEEEKKKEEEEEEEEEECIYCSTSPCNCNPTR